MKRVVISEIFPPRVGGSGRWLYELFTRTAPRDTLVIAGKDNGTAAFDAAAPMAIRRSTLTLRDWGVVSWRGWRTYGKYTGRIARLLRSTGVESIYCGRVLPEGWIGLRLRRKRGLDYNVFVHGEELNTLRTSRQLTWMAQRVFDRARRIIANSQNTAAILTEQWTVDPQRLAVLYPGVDTQRYRPAEPDAAARAALGWADRPVILTVGRLQKRKGHDRLIAAIKQLKQGHPQILLAVVGDGPERDALQAQVDHHELHDHVIFHGPLDDEQLLQAYQQCDLFVLANRTERGDFEGFGIVLLEAQACGKPVIAGETGGTRETLQSGQTGLLVDANNSAALDLAIDGLLNNPAERRRMGEAARQWAVEQFDWTVIAQQAEAILNDQ